MEMDDTATLAVVVNRLEDLRNDFKTDRDERRAEFDELRRDLRRSHEDKVSRLEWVQHNAFVDQRFLDTTKDIAEMKQEDAARRMPWTNYAAVVVSVFAVLWTLFSGKGPM